MQVSFVVILVNKNFLEMYKVGPYKRYTWSYIIYNPYKWPKINGELLGCSIFTLSGSILRERPRADREKK